MEPAYLEFIFELIRTCDKCEKHSLSEVCGVVIRRSNEPFKECGGCFVQDGSKRRYGPRLKVLMERLAVASIKKVELRASCLK